MRGARHPYMYNLGHFYIIHAIQTNRARNIKRHFRPKHAIFLYTPAEILIIYHYVRNLSTRRGSASPRATTLQPLLEIKTKNKQQPLPLAFISHFNTYKIEYHIAYHFLVITTRLLYNTYNGRVLRRPLFFCFCKKVVCDA